MIPKVAFFFWEGEPMSWLRKQTLESFKRLNPDWEVRMIDGSRCPIEPGGRRRMVLRSDWSRYDAIYENGGFYFDTDIIFLRPIPDSWLEMDVAVCVYPNGEMLAGVHAMGGVKGARFFGHMLHVAKDRIESGLVLDFQALGTKLSLLLGSVAEQIYATSGKFFPIPVPSLLPVGWNGIERLWSPIKLDFPSSTIGVHWYGGDAMCVEFEPLLTPESIETWRCPMADLFREKVTA